MNILGIETSCDETAAAVVADGTEILSSEVASQISVHHPFGGVVPELASRKHIEAIGPVVREALRASKLAPEQIDGLAVTRGPGLIGSLLVGFSFAKAYAFVLERPWVGVDHLEGHLNSVFLGGAPPPFPYVALLASGGHTSLYHVTGHLAAERMGQTRDDAAGEAYDKVAKMLGLGYPGGKIIDRLAAEGDPDKFFFPRTYLDKQGFDFSFSGLKTAVSRFVQQQCHDCRNRLADIAAGFQASMVEVLAYKVLNAAGDKECKHIALVGGVAANHGLRQKVIREAGQKGIQVHIPPLDLCGDNAAMIAAAGYHHLKAGHRADLEMDVYSRSK